MSIKPMKILVIDDDHSWQVYLFSALQAGFELRSAYDGTAALQLVPEFLPDCILLDIHMPGKNEFFPVEFIFLKAAQVVPHCQIKVSA